MRFHVHFRDTIKKLDRVSRVSRVSMLIVMAAVLEFVLPSNRIHGACTAFIQFIPVAPGETFTQARAHVDLELSP